MTSLDELTQDAIFGGKVRLQQHATGYRYSIDAILLAHFCQIEESAGTILDLGAGNGAVTLALAHLNPITSVRAVEVQPELAALAQLNIQRNGLSDRVRIDCADVRSWREGEGFDNIVMNPPFYAENEGRLNPDPGKAAARHELNGTIAELVGATRRLLSENGALHLVYPSHKLEVALDAFRGARLTLDRMRSVHPSPSEPARMVLLRARKGRGVKPLQILPGWTIRANDGEYTEEMTRMLDGRP
ncbi:MAG: methyltransferase [Myxococcales bacterium]|nr:methyltransferase [Myxococcales bacterium]